MNIRVTELDYHRNGVAGHGFVVARFTFRHRGERRNAIATIFETEADDGQPITGCQGHYAILVEDASGRIDIRARWRGDEFIERLRAFINSDAGEQMMWAHGAHDITPRQLQQRGDGILCRR